jgi:signal transduction histidine kinase
VAVLIVIVPAALVTSVAAVVVRLVRSAGEERLQLKWFAAAAAVAVVAFIGSVLTDSVIASVLSSLAFLCLYAAIAIAVLKYRLFEIDIVISKAVLYGSLAVFITAVYTALVAGVGTLAGNRHSVLLAALAAAVVAVVFQPARQWAGRMPRDEPLRPAGQQLVADVASQAGLVLANAGLIEDLRASRQRLVTAQDETRRRLERNLHDGAQQDLVALAIKAQLAVGTIDEDPAQARQILGEIKADAAGALANLRDLARGIYPPLLADLGLAAALKSQAGKSPLPVTVEADGIGRFGQDTEAAVYFCCLEALQNTAKYAQATQARICLQTQNGSLRFTVNDDGTGYDTRHIPMGSGLRNMADRLAALGGRLEVRSAPAHGTTITGHLPAVPSQAALITP